MMVRSIVALVPVVLLGLTGAGHAQAPDHPFVVPQHDVDVLYAVPLPVAAGQGSLQAGQPVKAIEQRMRFAASLQRQRVDPPGPGTYMITDYRTGQLIMVQPGQRIATSIPAPGGPIASPGIRATGDYSRLGVQTIAGVSCTDWRTRDDSGNQSVVCLTEDGVMLRAMQADHVLVQAIRVAFDRQEPSLFEVPAGYSLQRPAGRSP
ncbi:MAG: hypothetical protein ACRYGI_16865 [Janthinobacterium lividum]